MSETTTLMAKVECATPGCAEQVEIEVWEGWEGDRDGTYARILRNTIHCDAHEVEALEAAKEALRQKKREVWVDAMRYSGIPKPLRDLTWEDYALTEPEDVVEPASPGAPEGRVTTSAEASALRKAAWEQAQSWAKGEFRGLVLSGAVGIGKTRLAGIAARGLIYHQVAALLDPDSTARVVPIRWVSVPDLIHKSKGEFGSDRRREAEQLMSSGNGLVLDDVDKVKPTELSLDLLFEAVEKRENRAAPLLVTTNMRYPELVDHLGDPLASRIAGYCRGLRMVGEDRRTL